MGSLRAPSAVVIGLLLLPGDALAQDANDELEDLTLEELMQVRVETASYVLSDRQAQPVAMTTISHEQIERSSARTLNELLAQYVPGFFMVEDHDDTIAAFRGFAPDNNSKVLLLVDGHNINTEWFMGPPDALLNGLELSWIDHVEVIRGPGSVTLGQGALLGVINIVTRDPRGVSGATVSSAIGVDDLRRASASARISEGELGGTIYVGHTRYQGQPLEPRGWAIEDLDGGTPYSHGHRVKRGEELLLHTRLSWRDLELGFLHVDHKRDNYNFYRDREEQRQALDSLTLSWRHPFGEHWHANATGFFDRDDFGYLSHEGIVTAGTREDRVGVKLTVQAQDLLPGNRMALGVEGTQYRMGRRDAGGANFIFNRLADRGEVDNERNIYVNPTNIEVLGLFVEDSQRVGEMTTVFAGLRLDRHPFWGTALSPRAGVIVSPRHDLQLRLSYQTGFRGAPGVHYAGGWHRDGLVSESNFDAFEDNPLVAGVIGNIPPTKPERMQSLELGLSAQPHRSLAIDAVGFVSWMHDIIDVYAIDLGNVEDVPVQDQQIGTDPIGDWGGWFFFKNARGLLTTAGGEATVRAHVSVVEASVSYSAALLLDAPGDLLATMYVSGRPGDLHFEAYPEHVVRANVVARPLQGLSLSLAGLWFSRWYPPSFATGGASGEPGLVVDAGASYRFHDVELALTVKNLLDRDTLWPMNSNVGMGLKVSPGTPSLEHATGWLTLRAML